MRRLLPGTLIFAVALAVYTLNFRVTGAGDCWALRQVPVSLVREGNLDLNEFPEITFQVWEWTRDGRFRIPLQPALAGIMAYPVFLGADLLGIEFTPENTAYLAKFAASIYTALAAAVLFLGLARLVPAGRALLYAAAFAFGTCAWSVSSQDLWQHGPGHFLVAAGLYCLIAAGQKDKLSARAGLFFGLAAFTRGMLIPVSGMMAIYVLVRHPRRLAGFVLWSLPGLAYYLGFNLYYLGTPFHSIVSYALGLFSLAGIPAALGGLLFSPNRGLFVFSPFLIFSLWGSVRGWREPSPFRLFYRFLALACAVFMLFIAAWGNWWGGYCYGYRLLVDIAPLLTVLLVPAGALLRRRSIVAVFGVLLAWSILLQAAGALYYSDRWNSRRGGVDRHPERLWQVRGGQVPYMLRKAAARSWRVEPDVTLPRGQRSRVDRALKNQAED